MASASGAPAPVTVDIVGKVGVLTLNRPKRLNAWTGPMVRARHWHAGTGKHWHAAVRYSRPWQLQQCRKSFRSTSSPRTVRGRSDGHTCAQATLLFDSMLALEKDPRVGAIVVTGACAATVRSRPTRPRRTMSSTGPCAVLGFCFGAQARVVVSALEPICGCCPLRPTEPAASARWQVSRTLLRHPPVEYHGQLTMVPVPAGLGHKLPSRTFSVTGCCRCVCVPGGGADSEVDRRTVIFTTTIKKPVIAAINGPVAGIGLAFALAWCAPCPPLGVRAAHPSTRAPRARTSRRVTA